MTPPTQEELATLRDTFRKIANGHDNDFAKWADIIDGHVVKDKERHEAQVQRYILMAHAAIERCAQVAETRAARYDHQHNNQENALWQECLEIASAIRALKDKS